MVGKAQIVEGIAARGATRAAATAALDAVLVEITAALAAGERVTLTGFGTFEAVARAERTARNPRTGATVTVAATTVARFHPGAALRDAVASGDGHGDRPPVDLSGLDSSVTGNVKRRDVPLAAPAPEAVPAPAASPSAAVASATTKPAKAKDVAVPGVKGKGAKAAVQGKDALAAAAKGKGKKHDDKRDDDRHGKGKHSKGKHSKADDKSAKGKSKADKSKADKSKAKGKKK